MAFEMSAPHIEYRGEKHSLGIRTVAPFNGMFAVVDQLRKELYKWFKARGIDTQGPTFLRYHVIDMAADMEIEFGLQVPEALPGDEHVKPGLLPAGHYATLIYQGSGMQGNKALLNWARDKGIALDRWNDPKGDAFACRYEAYLTDPKIEPHKKKWDVDLSIKIAEGQSDKIAQYFP